MLHIKEIKQVDEEQAGRMCSCEAENMLSSVPIMQLFSPGDEGQCFHPEMKILPLFTTFSLTKTQKDDIINNFTVFFLFIVQLCALQKNRSHTGILFTF